MATIAKPKGQRELEEEQKKYVQDQGGQAGLSTGSPVGPVSSGGAPVTDQVNANPSDSNRSGLFTSFEKFKQANLPKAGALGERIGGDYTAAGDTQLQNIQDTSADYGQEVAQNTFQFGDEYLSGDTISGFRDEALGVVDTARAGEDATEQQLDDFGQLSNVEYGGPRDFSAKQKSGLERSKRRVDEIGRNLTSDSGRKQQLREHFKPTIDDYSRQASELDNLILKSDPAVQELYNAGSYIDALALDEAYSSALGNAEGLGTSVAGLHQDLKSGVRQDLTDTQSGYYGDVDKRLTDYENLYKGDGQARSYVENLIEDYQEGGALELSNDELSLLGLEEGDLLYNEFDENNLGQKEQFSRGSAIQEAEAKKLAELNALSKIAGTDAYGADLVTNQAGTFEGREFDEFGNKVDSARKRAEEALAEDIRLKGVGSHAAPSWEFGPFKGSTGAKESSYAGADLNLANKLGVDLNDPVEVDAWQNTLDKLSQYSVDDFQSKIGAGPGEEGSYIDNVTSSGGPTAASDRSFGAGRDYHPEDVNILEDASNKTRQMIEDYGLRNVVKGGAETPEEFAELSKYLAEKQRLSQGIV